MHGHVQRAIGLHFGARGVERGIGGIALGGNGQVDRQLGKRQFAFR
jgi:hypothetical protein